jgi:hypothetical protein
MGEGDLQDDSFPAKRGSKDTGQKHRKQRNNGDGGNIGKGRSMNPRGIKSENASSTAVTNVIRYIWLYTPFEFTFPLYVVMR